MSKYNNNQFTKRRAPVARKQKTAKERWNDQKQKVLANKCDDLAEKYADYCEVHLFKNPIRKEFEKIMEHAETDQQKDMIKKKYKEVHDAYLERTEKQRAKKKAEMDQIKGRLEGVAKEASDEAAKDMTPDI